MHPRLREVFNQTVELFADDPRVLAAWIAGSAKAKSEDVYSDVDPVFIIRDEDFDEFDRQMRSTFESIAPDVVLWWPERGNNDQMKNYAILFKAPMLLQYDMNIMKESVFSPGWLIGRTSDQILFDKTGILANALTNVPKPSYSPDKLLYTIELFWVYGYIIPKYLRRGQTFKVMYTQQEVFLPCHMEVLHALHPDVIWDWWPINAHKLFPPEKQAQLHRYFAASDCALVKASLIEEIDAFASDARAACEKWGLEYPDRLEAEVRRFIADSECLG